MALTSTTGLPVTAAESTATGSVPGDPAIGPHARSEASHAGQVFSFAPAHNAPMPLRSRTSGPLMAGHLATATGGQLQHEVFGFATYWELSQNANWNYSLLSTVAYFGLDVNANGSFDQSSANGGWNGWNSQSLVDLLTRAHGAGDRVVLVIKQMNESTLCQLLLSPAATQAAITNTINALVAKGLDGVNVDFEGSVSPGCSGGNIQAGFTNFMTELSQQVHQRLPGAEVSADTYSGSASWDSGFFNITALAPVVDAFFVMAYDMSFSNLPGKAGPNAPLNGWTYNDTTSVAQYLSKAPASKVILGVPYYGYKWCTSGNDAYSSASNCANNPGATADTYSQAQSDFSCALQLAHHWDTTAQSPWASWWSPASNDPCGGNHNSWRELYYDDASSLCDKYDLVNQNNLRGTGMWALGFDGSSPDLWSALDSRLTSPHPFAGELYTLDGFGGVHRDGCSMVMGQSVYWPGWRIARAATLTTGGAGGYVLDAYGGLHPLGAAPAETAGAYWPGWDIARDVVLVPTSTAGAPQGYTLDGFGGLHPFGGAPAAHPSHYWPGWDIAKRAVVLSDGSGGYVLDGYGGLHPFAIGTNSMPPVMAASAYWPGWKIARDVVLTPGSTAASVSGFTLDGFGGLHPFGSAASVSGYAYWRGWDIARAVRLAPGSTAGQPAGWVLDGYGGIHQFGGAPPVGTSGYWPGWDIATDLLAG